MTISRKKKTNFSIFLNQFKGIFIWILIIATIAFAILGYLEAEKLGESILFHMTEFFVILTVLFLNLVFGFYQEYVLIKTFNSLHKASSCKSNVIRDGVKLTIDSMDIVPGDVILLNEGDRVPADGIIVEQERFEVDESLVTGEGVNSKKRVGVALKDAFVSDKFNMVFSGAFVKKGYSKFIVTGVGKNTEIVKNSLKLEEEKTSKTELQDKLLKLSEFYLIIILVISSIVFIINLFRSSENGILESLKIALALAVVAIPVFLQVASILILSIASLKMLKKNSLIKSLSFVDKIGYTDYMITDTKEMLTFNQMTVREIFVNNRIIEVSGHGYDDMGSFFYNDNEIMKKDLPNEMNILFLSSILCNESEIHLDSLNDELKTSGDSEEIALIVLAKKGGIYRKSFSDIIKEEYKVPIDSKSKIMSHIYKFRYSISSLSKTHRGKDFIFSKGDLNTLLSKCSRKILNGSITKLTKKDINTISKELDEMESKSRRVVGFAYKEIDKKLDSKDNNMEDDLIFVGFAAMIDPLRKEVRESVSIVKEAGISIVIITEDSLTTAKAIAKKSGLSTKNVMTGEDLDKLSQEDFKRVVLDISVYARISENQKLRIINALKEKEKTVSIICDKTNDLNPIKKADIGISTDSGNDIVKEHSDIIILNSSFKTIIETIKEGRLAHANLMNFIIFLISSSLAKMLIVLFGVLFGFSMPISVIQLLWINIFTDGFLALSLGFEKYNKSIMKKKPMNIKSKLFSTEDLFRIFISGIIMMFLTLFYYYYNLEVVGISYEKATTIAFSTIICLQLLHAFNCRSRNDSILSIGIFTNAKLLYAVAFSFALLIFNIYGPLARVFGFVSLDIIDWIGILGIAVIIVVYDELVKFFRKTVKIRRGIDSL